MKLNEEDTEVLVVFVGRTAKDKDVVYVCKIQVFEYLIHETLEGVFDVTLAKGHEGKIKKAESCGDCCRLNVFGLVRYLLVRFYQVNLRKGGVAGNVVLVALYVWDWIPVHEGPSYNGSKDPTGSSTAVLLRYVMEGWQTRALGSSVGAFP